MPVTETAPGVWECADHGRLHPMPGRVAVPGVTPECAACLMRAPRAALTAQETPDGTRAHPDVPQAAQEPNPADVTTSVQHRCPRMRDHVFSGPLPAPCPECYSLRVTAVRIPYEPPTPWTPAEPREARS